MLNILSIAETEAAQQQILIEQQRRAGLEAELQSLKEMISVLKSHVNGLRVAQQKRQQEPLLETLQNLDLDSMLKDVQSRIATAGP